MARNAIYTATILTLALTAQKTLAEDFLEKFDDGSIRLRYSTNANGNKHGIYVEYHSKKKIKIRAKYKDGKLHGKYEERFENGKSKIRANYEDGELHGEYEERFKNGKPKIRANYAQGKLHGGYQEYEEKGRNKVAKQLLYSRGEVLIERGPRQIDAELAKIAKTKVKLDGKTEGYGYQTVWDRMKDSKQISGYQKSAQLLKQYRYLSRMPYEDIVLDYEATVKATAAADVLNRLQTISHTPRKPGSMSDEDFEYGKVGCKFGNLYTSKDADIPTILPDLVHNFMEDSGGKNIERVGHRRWCLHPLLLKTGFGSFRSLSAMWVNDTSRTEAPEYDFIHFPPKGYMPGKYFSSKHSWSVQPNPEKFTLNQNDIKVKVYPARLSTKTGDLEMGSEPLELDVLNVDPETRGVGPCLIFRPKQFSVKRGSTYAVVIDGIRTAAGEEHQLKYLVLFY